MNALYKKLRATLKQEKLLLLTDAALPSLTSIIAGEPVKGSWWGHPKGKLMYNLSNDLMDEKDVLTLKLVNKKVTFVDKRLWDALYAVGNAHKEWQMQKLAPEHKRLLSLVEDKGEVRADDAGFKMTPTEVGKLSAKLEERLLIYSESIHTDSGKHVRFLRTWNAAMGCKSHKPKPMAYAAAVRKIEDKSRELSIKYKARVTLPWE